MHLEQARLRLRQRFQSKFLDNMKEQPETRSEATMTLSPIESPSNDLLEEARLRIRRRFLDKFPPDSFANASVMASKVEVPETISPRKDDKQLDHLEAARLRIRERFQDKFPDFTAFPETMGSLQDAMDASEWGRANAVVVTSAIPPYPILNVNKTWEALCGFTEDQVRGKTFEALGIQGSFTEAVPIQELSKKLKNQKRAAVHLTNATQDGTLFRNYLRVAPIYDNDEVSHFVGVLQAQQQSL